MTLRHLIFKEFFHSRVNGILSMASIATAVCCLSSALALLALHDLRTESLLLQKQQETETRVAQLQEDYRVIMKKLGFNVLILPEEQDLGDFYALGFAEATMPEEYVYRLASNRLVTVRHLLPSLQQKVLWPEQQRKVLLMGIKDEVPIAEKSKLKSMVNAVEPGTAVLGHELAQGIGLKESDEFTLMDRRFTVAEVHAERGTMDDITIWLDLAEAQVLLGKEGLINGILALECACAWADIGKVRREIAQILPNTKVIESGSGKALTRAEGRYRAAEEARTALIEEEQHRNELRRELEAFASILVPGVVLAAVLWLSLLAFSNVKQRRYEIALLRALGMPSRGILMLILGKMGLMGFFGAWIGGLLGSLFILLYAGDFALLPMLFPPTNLLGMVTGAVLLSIMAGWIPALFAAMQDPADILREE